ncbi:MAG: hypothetical protein NTV08_09105 [Verrucomicrobia bacterium]|nr:hypothetical protein [Verrucomicrobiota bacterium]
MSQHIAVPNSEKFDATKGTLLRSVFSVAAAVGLLGAGVVYFANKELFAHVWLFAFMYFFTVLCGCFFWNCLHHATDSEWSVVIRRQVENLASLLKFIAIFFVPIALCVTILYAWMSAEPTKDAAMAGSKSLYLNKPFFWFRAVAFFALLGAISHILRKRSVAQDHDGAAKHTFSMRFWAILGIPTLAICLTFSGIDWMKALNHHWFSTMWGVYLFAGAAGASMALIVLVISWLRKLGYLSVVNDEHYHLMGKFLLAFTVFWAYIGFSQYMLITYANLDEETIYFRVRNTGTWNYFSHLLVFGRFFFMFVPLLFQGLKKSRFINFTAVWILLMQFLDIFLIVIPEWSPGGFSFRAALAAIFPWLGIGGCLGLLFLRHLGQGYLFPTKDPRLAGSLKASN